MPYSTQYFHTISRSPSIYIDEELRDRGYGKKLVNEHIKWLKEHECKRIRVAVSFGHDSVIEFYHKLGFYERLVYYELKDEKPD
jgi:ribosomal protein S18 acetylase RimI-like enzyme